MKLVLTLDCPDPAEEIIVHAMVLAALAEYSANVLRCNLEMFDHGKPMETRVKPPIVGLDGRGTMLCSNGVTISEMISHERAPRGLDN